MRIDAFLSHRGHGSRSEVHALLRRGRVTVDGKTTQDYGLKIDGQVVRVNGQVVEVGISEATLLLHKPIGYACSHDEREAPLVDALIPQPYQRLGLEMAGRLDRDTSGLLILTTDGQLIHRLTNPRKHLLKRYRIAYAGTLSSSAVERVAKGMVIEGDPQPTRPAELVLEGTWPDGANRATLLLSEGRYHQVRKMIAELGGTVTRLHRDRIGTLELPSALNVGQMREATAAELAALMQTPVNSGRPSEDPLSRS